MHIHDSLNFKSRKDLDNNKKNIESLSMELISKNSKNIVLSGIFRSPSLYNKILEKIVVMAKSKTLKNLWVPKGILKSSKTKQKLYVKLLKSKTYKHEIS